MPTPAPDPTSTPVPLTRAVLPRLSKVADLPGGHVSDIAFAPSDSRVAYLASNVNAMGVWRSEDSGETWNRVYYDDNFGATHVNTLAVHPGDAGLVLVGDLHGRISKTSDGGARWREVYEQGIPIFALAISPSMPSLAYAGDGQGNVLKSTDSGDTWRIISQIGGSGVGALAVSFKNPELVYASNRESIYESTDGGQHWTRLALPTFFGLVDTVDLAVSPEDSGTVFAATRSGVYRNSGGGTQWRLVLREHAHSVSIAPSDPRVVYAGTNAGVYKSEDGGFTWRRRNSGVQYLDIGPIAVDPQNPGTAILGNNIWQWTFHQDSFPSSTSGEGIYKTVDGGQSWDRLSGGFIDVDVVALAVDPSNADVAYVGMECSRGIFRTQDGGASWEFISGGPESGSWDIGHYTMRLATASDSTVYLTGRFGITRSSDGGQTWQPMLVRRHFHGVMVDPTDPQLVFTGTSPSQDPTEVNQYPGAQILRSLDGGKTWAESGTGFPSGADTSIHGFAVDPNDNDTVYVTTSSHEIGLPRTTTTVGIYKSNDRGQSWSSVNSGLATLEVDSIVVSPLDSQRLLAGTESGVFLSVNGGQRWSGTSLREPVYGLLIDPADPSSVFAGTEAGLYWSRNAGQTWERLTSVPERPVNSIAMDAKGKVLYAAVNGVGVFKGTKE